MLLSKVCKKCDKKFSLDSSVYDIQMFCSYRCGIANSEKELTQEQPEIKHCTKPKQYDLGIDTIEIMKLNATKEERIAFYKYNAMKYIMRDKGSDEEDLTKAIDYINLWKEEL